MSVLIIVLHPLLFFLPKIVSVFVLTYLLINISSLTLQFTTCFKPSLSSFRQSYQVEWNGPFSSEKILQGILCKGCLEKQSRWGLGKRFTREAVCNCWLQRGLMATIKLLAQCPHSYTWLVDAWSAIIKLPTCPRYTRRLAKLLFAFSPLMQLSSCLLPPLQSCEMSYIFHRANLSNQILPHEKCVSCDKFNT